jgi:hypothetical protein
MTSQIGVTGCSHGIPAWADLSHYLRQRSPFLILE